MSKESTKSAKVAYLKSKEGRSNVINCFWAIIIAIIFLFPIYWLIQMSFKTDMESFGNEVNDVAQLFREITGKEPAG